VSSTACRAAYYTAATIIVRAAASQLDIDPVEIEIASIHGGYPGDPNAVGEIMLSDHLPNGAGFVEWIKNNWSEILNGVLTRDNSSHAPALPCSCDAACYDCLLSYRNRPLHGLLDWRIGCDLLEIMRDATFECGLEGNFEAPSLEEWLRRAAVLRNAICAAFPSGIEPLPGDDSLPGFRSRVGDQAYLIAHPLWSPVQHAGSLVAQACTRHGLDSANTRLVNCFDLSRRMAWCWERVGSGSFPEITLANNLSVAFPSEVVRSTELPAGDEFTLQSRPRGLPAGRQARFVRPQHIENQFSLGALYLVRSAEGELVCGRISVQQAANGNQILRFSPANHSDGVSSFTVDLAGVVAKHEESL
jgi:hypothetical protein